MSDSPNNPVMTQPKRMSMTARLGIMAAMFGMNGSALDRSVARQGRRNGKHHGRNPGAFGKQK